MHELLVQTNELVYEIIHPEPVHYVEYIRLSTDPDGYTATSQINFTKLLQPIAFMLDFGWEP